ncbi:MAG: response regulator [Bacteroidia bacterium]
MPLPHTELDNEVLENNVPDTKLAHTYPLRILLAEDNMLNQRVARHMLKKLGYRIDVVENGKDAITQCKLNTYDLILMDINMPVLDGIEASRQILAIPQDHKPPVIIAMTASVVSQIQDECLEAGIKDFISKPFTFATLEKMIVHWGDQLLESAKG